MDESAPALAGLPATPAGLVVAQAAVGTAALAVSPAAQGVAASSLPVLPAEPAGDVPLAVPSGAVVALGGGAIDASAPPPAAPVDAPPSPTPAQAARAAMRERTNAVIARAEARLAAMTAAGPQVAVRCARLSDAEEVLAIPYLSERSVMSYLRQDEVLSLRAASRTCREAVAEHAWSDFDETFTTRSRIRGRLTSWRACFPLARAANLCLNNKLTDADFVHLRGV